MHGILIPTSLGAPQGGLKMEKGARQEKETPKKEKPGEVEDQGHGWQERTYCPRERKSEQETLWRKLGNQRDNDLDQQASDPGPQTGRI
jgi:hypothetical protein